MEVKDLKDNKKSNTVYWTRKEPEQTMLAPFAISSTSLSASF